MSGKGLDAGVRSLQLSGAFGGLLGAMPREEFLGAANEYLLDQDWDEGFATAIHVAVDLATRRLLGLARRATRPPSSCTPGRGGSTLRRHGRQPRARASSPTSVCEARAGRLDRGDVLMLYTDGVVEVRGGDLDQGIDRLMGVADRVLAPGAGRAAAVLAGVRAGDDDDRAVVLVRRD